MILAGDLRIEYDMRRNPILEKSRLGLSLMTVSSQVGMT